MPSGMELAIKAIAAAQAGKQRLQSLDPDVKKPEGPVTMENIPQNAEYINQRMARNVQPQGKVALDNPLSKILYAVARKRMMSLYPDIVKFVEQHPETINVVSRFDTGILPEGSWYHPSGMKNFVQMFPRHTAELNIIPSGLPGYTGSRDLPKNPFGIAAHEIFGHGTQDLAKKTMPNFSGTWQRFPGLKWSEPFTGDEDSAELLSTWLQRKFKPGLSSYGKPVMHEPYSFYNFIEQLYKRLQESAR